MISRNTVRQSSLPVATTATANTRRLGMDFHIGQKFKETCPPEAIAWAKENNARIVKVDGGFMIASAVKAETINENVRNNFPFGISSLDAELREGKKHIRRFSYPEFDKKMTAGFALIQCHFGKEEKQLKATTRAIEAMAESNPRPSEWLLVEAQNEGEEPLLSELAKSLEIDYLFVPVPEKSQGIFIKEALWNIGARRVKSDNLVFIDSDIIMCNRAWAHHVERAMDDFDFGSPHGFAYYAETPSNETDPDYNHIFKSSGCATMTNDGYGHPGFGLFMRRSLFDHIGGLPCLSSAGGDSWLWYRIAGHCRRPYTLFRLPYNAPFIYNFGIRPTPKIGSTQEVCCHIDHGAKQYRQYQAQALIGRWCTTMPFEDLTFNQDTGLPEWRDNYAGRVHQKARAEFMGRKDGLTVPQAMTLAREIYDRYALEECGEIDDDHPLIIATSLRSGDKYGAEHVLMLRDLFAKYCRTPHEFWCFSDIEINGVKTVPLVSTHSQTPYFYVQLELFRNVYPKGASVLTCDLDAIPIREFTMHRCPENQISMGWEQHNWPQNNRCIWNGGMTYFRGDFSFIFDDFMCNSDADEQMPSLFAFISSQEFMCGSLYRHGHIPHDILAHICMEFYKGNGKIDVTPSTIVHFLGLEKPWDLKQKPEWLPYLAWRPLERKYR